jgi:hypothetical protein
MVFFDKVHGRQPVFSFPDPYIGFFGIKGRVMSWSQETSLWLIMFSWSQPNNPHGNGGFSAYSWEKKQGIMIWVLKIRFLRDEMAADQVRIF